MKRTSSKKLLTFAVLTLFLLSVTVISIVSAQTDLPTSSDQIAKETGLASETPNLVDTQDNGTINDDSALDRAPDNFTGVADDNSTLYQALDAAAAAPNDIPQEAQPNYLAITLALVAIIVVIAGLAVFTSRRSKKK